MSEVRNAGRRAEQLWLVRLPMHLLSVVMMAGVALNLANVVARYFFAAPIFWAEEILVYSMVWAVFLALPTITLRDEHLRMDLFYGFMPGVLRRAVDLLCALLYVTCGAFAAFYSWRVISLLWTNKQMSVAVGLPMAVAHAALPIGLSLMIPAVVLLVIRRKKS
jgi:TRAP-type C4-dicarboxylate transport system permease small subunit